MTPGRCTHGRTRTMRHITSLRRLTGQPTSMSRPAPSLLLLTTAPPNTSMTSPSRPYCLFAHRSSPPSPRQKVMWHLTHAPLPCLQTPLHPVHIPPQCAHPQTASPPSTCQPHLPSSTPTPATQHLTHPCPQTSMAPLLNAPPAPTLCLQTPRPSPYLREPAQLRLQHPPRQLCMDCAISQLFAWAHEIPGAV